MTAEPERIEEQLHRSFDGEAWHGPAVLETLVGGRCSAGIAGP